MQKRALSLLAVFLLPIAAADAAELTARPTTVISGDALEIEITLEDSDPLALVISLDGGEIDRRELAAGQHLVKIEPVELRPGRHQLEVRGGALAATAEFRIVAGWLSIVPPLLAIGLALLFRDVLIALFAGIFSGGLILYDWSPTAAFGRSIDHFIVPAVADGDHAAILVFTTLLGGMVGLITKSGGTHGIIERLKPYATDSRRGQMASWLMGVLIFFDDYANTLIVGPTMRPITDKLKISREKLAYIVDSTAAPVVCLFPISTWVGFEIGLIDGAFKQLGLPLEAYPTFVQSIPYRFYPIFALIMVLTIAASRHDFGPMRQAERRARTEGLVLAADAQPMADYSSAATEPSPDAPKRALNAIVPILTVVFVTIGGLYVSGAAGKVRAAEMPISEWLRLVFGDANSFHALLWASLCGVVVAMLLPMAQKILDIRQAMAAMIEGFKAMLLALVVLTLAWGLSAVCGELQTANFLVAAIGDSIAPMWLSSLTFVLAAAIAFATGSSWGTLGILQPLIIPICHSLSTAAGHSVGDPAYNTFMFGTIAAVLTGSVWGDHCSPISDTTILSSMATGCDHIAHVRTQIPYALTIGAMALLVGAIPTSLGLSPWLSLLVGAGLIVGGVLGLGKLQARGEATT